MKEPEEEQDQVLNDFEFSTQRKKSDDDYENKSWDNFEPSSKFNDW